MANRTTWRTGIGVGLGVALAAMWITAAAPASGAEDMSGEVRLHLPAEIFAAPGIEMNVYFDNVALMLNPANYHFDVTCPKGRQESERWVFTPKPEDAGEYPFVIEVRNETNAVIARAQSRLRVAPVQAGAGRALSVLAVGDSLTHASIWPQQLLDALKGDGNPAINLVGSHTPEGRPAEMRHEGYGGWTAERFATHFTETARTGNYRERGSPFLYKGDGGAPVLDFPRYCADVNGGRTPDIVLFFLGCNDVFSATDETIESRIETMFTHYEKLVRMVRSASKDTWIGLMPPVPSAASQDAFGANYTCGQTRFQYRRNQHRVVERMLEVYGRREAENLFIVPAWLNLDCVHNYPMKNAPWNAQTTLAGDRLSNGVHPAAEGYRQIGDSVAAWLKARCAATDPNPGDPR